MAVCPVPPLSGTTAPCGDRPWERALLGPEGTMAWLGPHIIAVINVTIGTRNNPSAILLTLGSRGQEIPGSPAVPQPAEPVPASLAEPSQSPWASLLTAPPSHPSRPAAGWPKSSLQCPAAHLAQLSPSAVKGVPP